MQLLKKCIDFSWNNINSNQFTLALQPAYGKHLSPLSVPVWRYTGGEKKGNICTLSHGYVRLIGLVRLCQMCHIYAYAIKYSQHLEEGNKKKKRLCSLFLFSSRWCTGYDFLWFPEQTYSAGDVPRKHTHTHTRSKIQLDKKREMKSDTCRKEVYRL